MHNSKDSENVILSSHNFKTAIITALSRICECDSLLDELDVKKSDNVFRFFLGNFNSRTRKFTLRDGIHLKKKH
jgi:hypothetical protein